MLLLTLKMAIQHLKRANAADYRIPLQYDFTLQQGEK
jgi:hypothetical protein